MCFNKRAALEMQESRLDELEAARVRLRKRLTIKPELREFFDQDGQLILRRVHAERRWDGVSFIFTTSPFTIDDTIKAYFDKDVVEKSFQALKGVVRLRPIRHVEKSFQALKGVVRLRPIRHRRIWVNISPVKRACIN